MNKHTKIAKEYIQPVIERITMDNEISLALESNVNPPLEPGSYNMQPSSGNPFKTDIT
jgi:hypothetical protein